MPPVFYFTYTLGTWILDKPVLDIEFEISWDWITYELHRIWKPFLLGSLLTGAVCAAVGYFTMRALWRWHVVREWEQRKNRRTQKKAP
jgi:hypothetical protein